MIIIEILALLGSVLAIITFNYRFLRNFKADVNSRMDKMESKWELLDERLFLLSTGKTLAQAILDEKMKKNKEE